MSSGYFKDEGLTVTEILDDDMPNGVAAMERGDIDCYLRTVGEFQGLGRRKSTQGIIIGTIDVSTGGDGWAADQAIKTVCDLKGKTIAVEPNLPARLIMQMARKGISGSPARVGWACTRSFWTRPTRSGSSSPSRPPARSGPTTAARRGGR